jgi:hypothetical protein
MKKRYDEVQQMLLTHDIFNIDENNVCSVITLTETYFARAVLNVK